MPLHMTGLVSRRQLDHPNEKPPVAAPSLDYERVLKYNPNHDSKTGRFTSGGGGKPGGTQGPPTTDAFGRAIRSSGVKDKGFTPGKSWAEHSASAGRFDVPGGGYSPTQRTLDYRPARDTAQSQRQTLEYRPDRDAAQGQRQTLEYRGGREVAATPESRLKELDEMTAGYAKQLDEKGIGKNANRQIRASLGMIQRERTGLQRQLHPDTPARIKALGEMEAGYTKQLGEKGLGKRVARQIRSSLGMIRRERTGLTYKPR